MISVEMKDWRGTPIVPGSIVVYPGRQSSSMWMVEAEVLEVFQDWHYNDFVWALRVQPKRVGKYGDRSLKPVKLTALERVTVIQSPSERLANV